MLFDVADYAENVDSNNGDLLAGFYDPRQIMRSPDAGDNRFNLNSELY